MRRLRSGFRMGVALCLAVVLVTAGDAQAEVRTISTGLVFESQQELMSFLPSVDVGTHKLFPSLHQAGFVPKFPPGGLKFRLCIDPGYLNSHHSVFMQISYDDANIKPGGMLPVTFKLLPGGPDGVLRSGAGFLLEGKWRAGIGGPFYVYGDVPYFPNIHYGFQAWVAGYDAPMPNESFQVGAQSTVGEGFPIPIYEIAGFAKFVLKFKPGLFFKLRFKDLTGNLAVPMSESIRLNNQEVLPSSPVVLVAGAAGQVFSVKLPNDLRDTSNFHLLLSSINYEDDLKISPTVGLSLAATASLSSGGDDQNSQGSGSGSGGSTGSDSAQGMELSISNSPEPPDGDDNDLDPSNSGVPDFGEITLSLGEVGYETPTITWDLGNAPGVGSLFTGGWNLPLNKENRIIPIAVPAMADLVVPAASATQQGGQITATAEIDNQGTAAAGQFKVKWYLEKKDGSAVIGVANPVQTDTVASLDIGGVTTLTYTRAALPVGEYRIRVIVDTDGDATYGQVVELCEINNNGQASLNSTLDLSASLPSPYYFLNAGATQTVPGGEYYPGRRFFIKATVSRRANDIAVPHVPVEIWVQRHNCSSVMQGDMSSDIMVYGMQPSYTGSSVLIGRGVVDLSTQASASIVLPWVPPADVDANYEIRVKVDPEGQIDQWLAGNADTTQNDIYWGWRPIKRPYLLVDAIGASAGTGVAQADWTIGAKTIFWADIRNSSPSKAESVPVQIFIAGRLKSEQTISLSPNESKRVQVEQVFTRDDLYRDDFWSGGQRSPKVQVRVVIDPRDEVRDRHDGSPNVTEQKPWAPPMGDLRALLEVDEQLYAGEATNLSPELGNAYSFSFPAGQMGKIGGRIDMYRGDGDDRETAALGEVMSASPAGSFLDYYWLPKYTHMPPIRWVPAKAGVHTLVSTILPPFAPGKADDADADLYCNDLNMFDNTVVWSVSVSQPRPDLQAMQLYPAEMPTRDDLANLRRLSGRVADAFSGLPWAQSILKKSTGLAYAGAPVTIALQLANPKPSEQFPVVPADAVKVNLYAVYKPEWQQHAKLADAIESWREIRDEKLPQMGRPIRQAALFAGGPDLAPSGQWLMPTHDTVAISMERASRTVSRPLKSKSASSPSKTGSRTKLGEQASNTLRDKTAFDLLRDFNASQTEVLLISTQVLDRVEDGALVSFQWRPPHGGKWLLSAMVDPGDEIFERNEDNNSAEMMLDVRPSLHYFANTPPLAIAGVRVGRGTIRSDLVEAMLQRLAGAEPALPKVDEIFPIDRSVREMWQELRAEAERRSAGMPALAKRRAITIRQGQTFTLIGSRSIDREHDIVRYCWSGPNVGESSSYANLVVDTSEPGRELAPGVHRFTLRVCDMAGLVSSDDVFVTVVKGSGAGADLVPVAISTVPAGVAADCDTTVISAIENQGGGRTDNAFKVQLFDGNTKLAEQTYGSGIAAGETAVVEFADAWKPAAGVHKLRVVVDATNCVAESNESNNTQTVTTRVDGNAAPIADLGSEEFIAQAGKGLFIDAYRSWDPDGHIIRYEWFINGRKQTGVNGRRFRYVAPSRAGEYKLKLVVVDNHLPQPKLSRPAEATIRVVASRNQAPVVQLVPRVVVTKGRRLTIPAAGCYDPDGAIASFLWTVKGAAGFNASQPNLVLDTRDLKAGSYVAQLEVTDSAGAKTTGQTNIYVVENQNRAPVIQIPMTVKVVKGDSVTLDASRSYDVDGRIAEYLWIVPKTNEVHTGEKFPIRTDGLGFGPHMVILAVSDDKGATTTRPITLLVVPPGGKPASSETGYDSDKPAKKSDLEKIEAGEGKPPSGAKPLKPSGSSTNKPPSSSGKK